MKRILVFAMAIVTCFLLVACSDAPGSEGLEYSLAQDGTYVLSGIGICKDYSIVIPSKYNKKPVSAIGAEVFKGTEITDITISKGVTSIGRQAFRSCVTLNTMSIPNTVVEIGNGAFIACIGLKTINYDGTKKQFEAIKKGDRWDSYVYDCTVYCTDGTINIDYNA